MHTHVVCWLVGRLVSAWSSRTIRNSFTYHSHIQHGYGFTIYVRISYNVYAYYIYSFLLALFIQSLSLSRSLIDMISYHSVFHTNLCLCIWLFDGSIGLCICTRQYVVLSLFWGLSNTLHHKYRHFCHTNTQLATQFIDTHSSINWVWTGLISASN